MTTIIDYGMGNLGSIKNMIKKIGHTAEITDDIEVIRRADKLILPGVGAFDRAMSNLKDLDMIALIQEKAKEGTPILGICLGMQLLADSSEEGILPGLGLIPGKVTKFLSTPTLKVPHMGWNILNYTPNQCRLFTGFDVFEETRFYFVHSYHYVCSDAAHSVGTSAYGINFTAAVQRDNIVGVQFHPEKSHKFGMLLLKNFIENY